MRSTLFTSMLGACTLISNADGVEALDAHRWTHRLLIAFVAEEAELETLSLNASLAAAACELEDRNMVIGWIVSEGVSRLGDVEISSDTAELLRDGFGIPSGAFTVLLIGKDGGVKARYEAAPSLGEIFALIDGMPMRRSEMRSRPSACAAS